LNAYPATSGNPYAAAAFALVWTAANLAVTASRTHTMQIREGGVEVKGQVRWLVIPWVL
jgi:hypothetical protein